MSCKMGQLAGSKSMLLGSATAQVGQEWNSARNERAANCFQGPHAAVLHVLTFIGG